VVPDLSIFTTGLMKRSLLLPFCFTLILQFSCSTSAFFYYPIHEIKYHPDTTQCRYETVDFPTAGGSKLNGWFIKPKAGIPITGTVLFFHGNGGNIGYQFAPLIPLAAAGFQSLVFDYRGYGDSPGKPSQEKVLEDGLAALDYIRSRDDVKGTKLILFGQSLGGHLAIVVTAQKQNMIDALITEGAFTAHEDIAVYRGKHDFFAPGFLTRWCVPSKYDAIDVIQKISIPKLFIHSSEDETIPFRMGKQLYEKAAGPKEFWEIKGPHIRCCKLYTAEFVQHFEKIIE
jgi:fermentation-respiration switch protein FrsA (DUF1100 family)